MIFIKTISFGEEKFMACSCHGKKGEIVSGKMPPDSQCTTCAYKHIEIAYTAYNELSYEIDNREFCAGHLRLAIEHLKLEHKDIALQIRDLATQIELVQDVDRIHFTAQLKNILRIVRGLMQDDHTDIKTRLEKLKELHAIKPDIIIPLGDGSNVNNDELKILLRSIEKNLSNYGTIYLVTTHCPEWINKESLQVVEIPDIYGQNKDANLHKKTLETIEKFNIKYFIWCSDDNAIMQPIEVAEIPTLVNGRNRDAFENGGRWQKRVKNTFDFADKRKVHLEHHFEVHAPQLFDGKMLLEKMKDVDYVKMPGLTIYTTWRVVTNTYKNALPQNDFKLTLEMATPESINIMTDNELQSRLFIGYNDSAVESGLMGRLFRIFPQKSRYEV